MDLIYESDGYVISHSGVGHDDNPPGRGSGRYAYGTGEKWRRFRKSFSSRFDETYDQLISEGMDPKETLRVCLSAFRKPESPVEYYNIISHLRSKGIDDKDTAAAFDISLAALKNIYSNGTNTQKSYNIEEAKYLFDIEGKSKSEIGRIMGVPDTTVGNWLRSNVSRNTQKTRELADTFKRFVDANGSIDIGAGNEILFSNDLGFEVSEERIKAAVSMLEAEGYEYGTIKVPQLTTNHTTNHAVLWKKGEHTWHDFVDNPSLIEFPYQRKIDIDGNVMPSREITNIDGSRVYIRYPDEGGGDLDGTMEIRRGVEDLNLGENHYAQVRIGVDGTHYLKGVALYSDDIPPGYDIVFNTGKSRDKGFYDVLKKQDPNPFNPFGSSIKTEDKLKGLKNYEYIDSKTGEKKVSAINFVNEEGDWGEWSRNIPSQVWSKQTPAFAKAQLDWQYSEYLKQFEDIMALTNNTVKRHQLEAFSETCDTAAVNLKAHAMPGQRTQLLLPVPDMPKDQVYAPNFKEGEAVCLIRFPHAGQQEIPRLIVNNHWPSAVAKLGPNPVDAIGVNKRTLEQLSGADCDGDTAVVIPDPHGRIKNLPAFRGMVDFDAGIYEVPKKGTEPKRVDSEGHTITKKLAGQKMGVVTNLLTDMGMNPDATDDELTRVVKMTQVIIDAHKHYYDWKKAWKDLKIQELRDKYQPKKNEDGTINYDKDGGGASTLISKAKSPVYVEARKERMGITPYNPETGRGNTDPITGEKMDPLLPPHPKREKVPVISPETGKPLRDHGKIVYETYTNAKGEVKYVQRETGEMEYNKQKSVAMRETKDAYTLVSAHRWPMELVGAEFANKMKDLGNKARVAYLNTPTDKRDPEAAKKYAPEVAELKEELRLVKQNAPFERHARIVANQLYESFVEDDPTILGDPDKVKKKKGIAMTAARDLVHENGSKKHRIDLTKGRRWEAIQNHAIGGSLIEEILKAADADQVTKLATPHETRVHVTPAMVNMFKAMAGAGCNNAEIAEQWGISPSTVAKYLKGWEKPAE
jgi:predicted transcriptional regulator